MSRLGFLLLLAFALAAVAGFGCYTMVRHPGPEDVSFNDSAGKTCLDCHADTDYYHWTDPYYTAFYNDAPGTWGAYYAHPWWYNEYWYRVPGASRDSTIVGGRHAWDRGPTIVPIPPVAGSTVVSSGTRGSVSTPNDTSNAPKRESPPDREKSKDDNKRRNAWGR